MAQAGPVYLLLHNVCSRQGSAMIAALGTTVSRGQPRICRACFLSPSMTSGRQGKTQSRSHQHDIQVCIIYMSSAAQLMLAAASCGAGADLPLLWLPCAGASLQHHQSSTARIRAALWGADECRNGPIHLGIAHCGAKGCPGSTAGVLG